MSRDDDGPGLGLIGLGIGAIIGIGAFAYSKFKKQSETSSSESAGQITYDDSDGLYEPSDYDDLLDFEEDHIGSFHTMFCRYIPALAMYISALALTDAFITDEENISAYVEYVAKSWLEKYGEQTEYTDLFVNETISQVKEMIEKSEERETNIEILKQRFRNIPDLCSDRTVVNEMVITYTLILADLMVPASYSYLYEVVKDLGISKKDIKRLAKEAEYDTSDIMFPELPVKTSDLSDILDFNDDLFFLYYHNKQHLYYCRMAPALAACVCIKAGINIYDYDDINYYRYYFLNTDANSLFFSPDFINDTIDTVYQRQDQITKVLSEIRDCMDDESNLRITIPFFALLMTPELDIQCFDVFFRVLGLTTEEMNEVCSRITTYENLDFNQIDGFRKFSADHKNKTAEYLKILGLSDGATNREIKHAFRTLSRKFHPDSLSGKELDDAFIQFASDKFRDINEAYNYLMNENP